MRRALITGQTIPLTDRIPYAIASKEETPTQGLSVPNANPLTVAMPMRIPVKDPGPTEQAIQSIFSTDTPAVFSIWRIIGSSVVLCVCPELSIYCATNAPSRHRAAEAVTAVLSNAKIYNYDSLPFAGDCTVIRRHSSPVFSIVTVMASLGRTVSIFSHHSQMQMPDFRYSSNPTESSPSSSSRR